MRIRVLFTARAAFSRLDTPPLSPESLNGGRRGFVDILDPNFFALPAFDAINKQRPRAVPETLLLCGSHNSLSHSSAPMELLAIVFSRRPPTTKLVPAMPITLVPVARGHPSYRLKRVVNIAEFGHD